MEGDERMMLEGRPIGHMLRSHNSMRRAQFITQRWLLAMLCALASLLSLTLGACSGPVLPPGFLHASPPTSAPHNVCASAGEAPRSVPGYELPATLPLVANGVVYVGYALTDPPGDPLAGVNLERNYADQFALAALRASDGATLWRVATTRGKWPFTVTGAWPLVVADGVLVAYDTGLDANGMVGLVGLRASDGAMLWRTPLDFKTMTARGNVLYATTNDGVSALRVVDGHPLWQTPVHGAPLSAPLVVGASLYIASTYGAVVALRTDTGAVLWDDTFDPISPQVGQYLPLGVIEGWLYVYVPNNEPQGIVAGVLRLNPASGESQGEILKLPPSTEAVFPMLQAGIFYAVVLPFGTTPPESLPALTAYRLSVFGSQLLWRSPLQQPLDTSANLATYDAQTFYLKTRDRSWTVAAFRLSDGALMWQRQALQPLAAVRPGIAVDAGEMVETTYGQVAPCHTPPIDQAPQIRAFTSSDGRVVWTRVLDARP